MVRGEINEETAYIQARSPMARTLEVNGKACQAEGETYHATGNQFERFRGFFEFLGRVMITHVYTYISKMYIDIYVRDVAKRHETIVEGHKHIHVRIHQHLHQHLHLHVHVHLHLHIHLHLHTHKCTCMYMCVCVCVCVWEGEGGGEERGVVVGGSMGGCVVAVCVV